MVAEPGRLALGVLADGQARPPARPAARMISPRRAAAISGTPCGARIAGSAGSSPSASRLCTSSTAPAAIIALPAAGDGSAQRLARRVEQDGGEGIQGLAAAQAASARRPAPPRCRATLPTRGRCAGCRRGAGGRPSRDPLPPAARAAPADQARREAPAPRPAPRPAPPARQPGPASAPTDTAPCRRTGSAAARRRLPAAGRPVPPPPPGHTGWFGRRPHAIQPVRHARLLFRCRPRRQDAQLAHALHRIGVDHHPAEALGQRQRQGGFAAGRGAGENQGAPRFPWLCAAPAHGKHPRPCRSA